MFLSMCFAYIEPYCIAFGENTLTDKALCYLSDIVGYPIVLIYMTDVLVEVIAAAPVYGTCKIKGLTVYEMQYKIIINTIMLVVRIIFTSGFYYKFWDGLRVKVTEPMFYFDILAALPLAIFGGGHQQTLWNVLDAIFKSVKLWKVSRLYRTLLHK